MSSGLRAFIFHHKTKTERRRAAAAPEVQGSANHPLISANQRTYERSGENLLLGVYKTRPNWPGPVLTWPFSEKN